MTHSLDQTTIYETRQRIGLPAAGFIAGGVLVFLVMIFCFVVSLASTKHSQPDWTPGLLGGMGVGGVAMLSRGIFLLRAVVRVILDQQGLRLEGLVSRRSIAWSDIERIEREKKSGAFGNSYNLIQLIGPRGKKLASIPDTIDRFEELAADIAARSAAVRGKPTFDAAENEQRLQQRSGKRLRWTAFGMGIFTLGMGAAFVAGLNNEWHERRYHTEGVTTNAKIDKLYMVRVTPRVEYSFTDAQGRSFTREAMMQTDAYDELIGQKTVPVQYLASDPSWNRLVSGEEKETSFGGKFLPISGGGTLMFGFFFVLLLLGIDINTDHGGLTITRHGKIIKQLGDVATAKSTAPFSTTSFPQKSATFAPPPNVPMPAPATIQMPLSAAPVFAPIPQPAPGVAVPLMQAPIPKQGKPQGIMALGILAILFGLLGMAINALRLVVMSHRTLSVGGPTFVVAVSRWLRYWTAGDLLLAGVLMIAGIGLLLVKSWGRKLALLVAALQTASSIGTIVYMSLDFAHQEIGSGAESQMIIASAIGAIVGQVIGMILPVVILIVLARPSVREAFEHRSTA